MRDSDIDYAVYHFAIRKKQPGAPPSARILLTLFDQKDTLSSNSLFLKSLVVRDVVDGSSQSKGSSGIQVLYEARNVTSFKGESNTIGRSFSSGGRSGSCSGIRRIASCGSSARAEVIAVGVDSGSSFDSVVNR